MSAVMARVPDRHRMSANASAAVDAFVPDDRDTVSTTEGRRSGALGYRDSRVGKTDAVPW
jgi:hypothetical protein